MANSQPQSVVQQQQAQQAQNTVQQPQVITLQQLQNFLPQQATTTQQIHQLNASDAAQLQQQVQAFQQAQAQAQAQAVANSSQQTNAQAQQIKTIFTSPNGQQQVINLPQQFIQVKNEQMPQQIIQLKQPDGSVTQQIIQLKPNEQQQMQQQVIQGGQFISGHNGIFQVVQPVTVDGQEALFIPNQMGNQPMQQAFITPSGQIVRMAAPGNFLHNMAQTVQLPNGE